MSDNIARLKDTIRRLHGCDATHVESVPVTETFHGQTVWEGHVEVFCLIGHPKAQRCYAWTHSEGQAGERSVAVLEMPPVDSPQSAVRAAIVAESKKKSN
jgi:hypothetical protein